ncbi:MAG: hypothetical protein HZC55_07950 [Verrucomicrobia bacterium]|nr:hypothetical protein [Verrucomicrobiota bacterium]
MSTPLKTSRPASAAASARATAPLTRRNALKCLGVGATALAVRPSIMAGPFTAADFDRLVPADKKLQPAWVESLFARGTPEIYRGSELDKIGMPIGGIGTGQVYLGGDGRLWHWDIFNQSIRTDSRHYEHPPAPASPLEQGFALRVQVGDRTEVRPLDRRGFPDISFRGEYPLARVDYRDPSLPVAVTLEAFSPFIPLDAEASILPATVLQFTVKNTGTAAIEAGISGWLENAVALHSGEYRSLLRRNSVRREPGALLLECTAEAAPPGPTRPVIVFADFEGETYGDWKVEGEAFGPGPARGPGAPNQRLSGFVGRGLANSYRGSDRPKGRLLSPTFTIERQCISLLVGGGDHAGRTCVSLVIDGRVVREARGQRSDALAWVNWGVREFAGRTAHLEIIDQHDGGWGHIDVDQIEFRDEPRAAAGSLTAEPDWGSLGLALLDATGEDSALARVATEGVATGAFAAMPEAAATAEQVDGRGPIGALRRRLLLGPGASATVTFVVAWHFPNDVIARLQTTTRRRYAARFVSATEVLRHVRDHFPALAARTRQWHATWHDSTLPHWFLNRTFLNTSILATSTSHWFTDNRFYGWEGVGCCPGTCTHVWHYAHAPARLFPVIERSLRELTDYGVAFEPDTGRIRFRAEHNNHWAADGQAGTILRVYREHQMSADDAFLRRLWPRVRRSLEFLMAKDAEGDGLLDGPQHNTLDHDWYGQVAWLSGLYVAALRAGEEMARELGETAFAEKCRDLAARGRRAIGERLFNGEYFIQVGDPAHAKTVGSYDGCEIDQVFGQSWAWQVGLGRVLDEDKVKTALRSLWRYNFSPDVGVYRQAKTGGRWFALAGEAGLLMGTWPRGEAQRVSTGYDYYFNECMNGFEYQAAGHLIWEGMLLEGLAITRAVHDRYHPARRNPWNEVECGDHYARSMASYGVFLAACGFEYHGPQGHLGFAPRLRPEEFRAAFTSAEGWGTLAQSIRDGVHEASVRLAYGRLRLRTLALATATAPGRIEVQWNGRPLAATAAHAGSRLTLTLPPDTVLTETDTLVVRLRT